MPIMSRKRRGRIYGAYKSIKGNTVIEQGQGSFEREDWLINKRQNTVAFTDNGVRTVLCLETSVIEWSTEQHPRKIDS